MGLTPSSSALAPNLILPEIIISENNTLIAQNNPQFVAQNAFISHLYAKGDIRQLILEKMLICESSNNPNAINPCDKDFTPSYGCLQFKPNTLKGYAKKYNLADTSQWSYEDAINWTFDCEFETKIFLIMLDDEKVDFTNEFPDCFRRYKQLFFNYWAI